MAEFLNLTINGIKKEVVYSGKESLLEILREQLDMTGAKEACGYGACGACCVVVNGEAVLACTYRGKAKLEGADVLTVEGLAGPNGELHPIQEAFIEAGAVQCGFCTPGFIMRLYGLFTNNIDATEDEIKAELKKHICRCTGYEAIWNGALLAQKKMKALNK